MEFAEFDIEFLAQKLTENPQSPLFARLADLYVEKEQATEAMKLLKEGIALFPDYYAAYIVLGKAHLVFKEYSRAQNALKKALELSPFNQYATQLLISVPNKPDESTRTTDETYFIPALDAEQETIPPVQFETPVVEEFGNSQQLPEIIAAADEAPSIHTQPIETLSEEVSTTAEPFPSYDDYFAQNQSRIDIQSPLSLDDYLSGDQSVKDTVVSADYVLPAAASDPAMSPMPEMKPEPHTAPEPVFASPEQAQLFAEMNATNEGPTAAPPQSSTDIDSLAEKLQKAEKIVPQENYKPKNPVPQEAQNDQAYETDAVTPTLAEIYASQGEYRAAIQAYEILMFSKPEKGGEYQQRIRELQQKQMEKDGLI